jgi:hypothetical protein
MTDSPKPQGRQFGFHGREREFAWLRGMFDAVATKGADGKFTGPRMAIIVAESGIGKSRLVQELYIRLMHGPQRDLKGQRPARGVCGCRGALSKSSLPSAGWWPFGDPSLSWHFGVSRAAGGVQP